MSMQGFVTYSLKLRLDRVVCLCCTNNWLKLSNHHTKYELLYRFWFNKFQASFLFYFTISIFVFFFLSARKTCYFHRRDKFKVNVISFRISPFVYIYKLLLRVSKSHLVLYTVFYFWESRARFYNFQKKKKRSTTIRIFAAELGFRFS